MTQETLWKMRIGRIEKLSCLSLSVEQSKLKTNLLHAPRCFFLNFIGEIMFKDVTMTRFEEEKQNLNFLNFLLKEAWAYLEIILWHMLYHRSSKI